MDIQNKSRELKKDVIIAIAIFITALLIRGVYLYESSDNPTFKFPIVDSATYDETAIALIEANYIDSNIFWQPVFYPLFIALLYALSNTSIIFVKIVQSLIGCFVCVLTYIVGKKIFDRFR